MLRPPAPASLVQMLNSAKEQNRGVSFTRGKTHTAHTHTPIAPTWYSSLGPLQARPPGANFVGSTLTQGPDGKLEGAAGHVHAVVLDTDRVHARLGGDEADAVGVVLSLHDVGFVDLT